MLFASRFIESSGNRILNICDTDLVDKIIKDGEVGEKYNIGGNYTCTIGEMLKFLLLHSIVKNIKIEVDEDRLRPIDADLQIPNTSKFCKHTGWKPELSFEKTMIDLLNYWRIRVTRGRNYLTR